ncbi:phage terminase small subunit [Streptomyces lydicus]|uniref:phage terminase small subunit n=1 Tax=Streptomyces lydicus TaxID=47763 RepID=UPI0037AB1973
MGRPRNPSAPYSRFRGGAASATSKLITLPPECPYDPPPVPAYVDWDDHQRARWVDLWKSPQATQWDQAAAAVVAVLVTYEKAILTGNASAWMAQEWRYASTALGLTPEALQKLNWTIGDGDDE